MHRVCTVCIAIAVLGISACRVDLPLVWFDGSFQAALTEAAERDTVVMVEFYTDWCNWCRRLESDTFTDPKVRAELAQLVAVKLDAEKSGVELAARYGVNSFPTMIFFDARGNEMERILGYLPPDKFLRRVQRIRSGDTFLACLRMLEEDPGDVDAIERSVSGLLERSDPEGAISRVEAFHKATGGEQLEVCRRLMFTARAELHTRVYQRAGRLFRQGWDRGFEVPDTDGTASLNRIIENGLMDLPAENQAELLRNARYEDAATLLEIPDLEYIAPDELLGVADFSFSNGHFDFAAELYLRWYEREGPSAPAGILNDVAWRLYLSGRELEEAIQIARRSYAANPDPEAADTLARLLYARGEVAEAVEFEELAAESTEGSRGEAFRIIAERMTAGEKIEDRPTFDSYPGRRKHQL
ncbi:MAG: thioredoxin fold domain-containing protein [Acidobacteriota bacterium]|nr:thioredoxin fold domain-containing protein [Acidobacteriota bacterium]